MDSDDKLHHEVKKILEEQHGRQFSTGEVEKAARDLKRFAEISLELYKKETARYDKLKENPNGFHPSEGGDCPICGTHCKDENSWYDKYGFKCMLCQQAINAKIIHGSVALKKESWYSRLQLETYFNIQAADLKKFLKQDILKARIIPGKGKRPHAMIFLLKDNKDFLPPKSLLKSRVVKTIRKGEELFTSEEWYEFADEKLARKLAKYGIAPYLKELFSKPVNIGRFYWKSVNPLFAPHS